jgi:hypothetical protein
VETLHVIPHNFLPSAATGAQPPGQRDIRRALRIMFFFALAALLAAWFWREAAIGLLFFLG